MKARDIVGKRVAAVRQEISHTHAGMSGKATTLINEIVFNDGTRLVFFVREQDDGGDYGIEPVVYKPNRSK